MNIFIINIFIMSIFIMNIFIMFMIRSGGPLGLSIIGGSDHSCIPFGTGEQVSLCLSSFPPFPINPLQIFGSNLIRQSLCISSQKQGQISPLLAESDNLGNLDAISYISFSSHLDFFFLTFGRKSKDWIDNPKKIHS